MNFNIPKAWLYFMEDREARRIVRQLESEGETRIHQTRDFQVGDYVFLMIGEEETGRVIYKVSVSEIAEHSATENEIRFLCTVKLFDPMLISSKLRESVLEELEFPIDRCEYDIVPLDMRQSLYLQTVFGDRNRYEDSNAPEIKEYILRDSCN